MLTEMCTLLCAFLHTDFKTKEMAVCPITPWTCPDGQLPYNVLPERGAIEDFAGQPTGGIGGFPGKCKVAPPLDSAKGPDANGNYNWSVA